MGNLNNELLMVFIPGISWILFALGGTGISATKSGSKIWRRYVLAIVYFVSCLLAQIKWLIALAVGLIAHIVYRLGYGDRASFIKRVGIGIGYSLISAPIGISWWNLVTAIGFIGLFYLSRFNWSHKIFIWKICEGFFGLLVGIQLAYSLMGKGLIW